MSEEKKNKTIAASVTTAVMIALLLMMLFCGLSYQNPPPPAKKAILIELSTMGGGGGGGNEAPSKQQQTRGSAENIVTQNSEDAPSIPRNDKKVTNTQPTVAEPKPDPKAMYTNKGLKGGQGGNEGHGSGGDLGDFYGPGKGPGPGGIGYGTAIRDLEKQINTSVSEIGQVCVEVHVMADGSVSEAKVIPKAIDKYTSDHKEYNTTITNRAIQQQCVQEARRARYKPGKEEYRIIVFK